VISSSDWYNLVAWVDRRSDDGDIYLKAISNAGIFAQASVRVNQDGPGQLQTEPSLAVSASGGMVVWVDGRSLSGASGQRVFGRPCSAWGVFSEGEFLISDTTQVAVKSEPKAALFDDGSGLVAWIDRRDGTPQVLGKWLSAGGGPDGADFVVSGGSGNDNRDLHAGLVGSGNLGLFWLDRDGAEPTVRGRWFDAARTETGSLAWSSSVSQVAIDAIAADVTADGEVILVWTGVENDTRRLYLTRLAADGIELTAPFPVTDHADADAGEPSVSVDENGYIAATWLDHRDGRRRVYYQLYDGDLLALGGNQPVSAADVEFMVSPAVWAERGRAWFVWADPRQDGLNIFLANRLYLPSGTGQDDGNLVPASFTLSQNFPNPFNPSTEIAFAMPQGGHVTVTVYNVLGREIKTLTDRYYPAGEHRLTWDGEDASGNPAATGVYFYRMTAGDFSDQRKMILLR
jgi:hypothetical protein